MSEAAGAVKGHHNVEERATPEVGEKAQGGSRGRVIGGTPGGSVSAPPTPLQSTVKKSMMMHRKRGRESDDSMGSISAESSAAGGASPVAGSVSSMMEQAVARKRSRHA